MTLELTTDRDVKAANRDDVASPLQQRYVALQKQQREIVAEMRDLKRRMRIGLCEICGKEFVRERVTRRYCGQSCTMKAMWMRRHGAIVDNDAAVQIREALPLLRAGRLMTVQSLEIVTRIVDGQWSHMVAAENVGISKQRVSQVMGKAAQLAKLALAMKAAVLSQAEVLK